MVRKPEVVRAVKFSVLDGISHPDSITPFRNQTISWSGPTAQLLGYALEEIENTEDWWIANIHPDDREGVVQSLSAHLRTAPVRPFAAEHRLWSFDYRFRHADSTYVLISDNCITTRDLQGEAISLQCILYDKAARRKARQEHARLLDSKNHLSLVANNTPSGIYMMDPQGYCIFMNKSAERITGFTFDEIYGHTFHASTHSCHQNGVPYPIFDCPIFGHSSSGTVAHNEPEMFLHKDGHHFDIEFSVSPIENYSTGGAIVEFRDVTKQKRIERERINAILMNEQQSSRIAADQAHKENMASFVSFVCHELRNPLQGVTSSTDFLDDTLKKIESLTKSLSDFTKTIPSLQQHPTVVTQNAIQNLSLTSSSVDPKQIAFAQNPSISQPQPSSDAFVVNTVAELETLIAFSKELVGNIRTCTDHQALITNNVLDLSRLDAGKVEPVLDLTDIQALGRQVVEMMSARARNKHIRLSMTDTNSGPLYLKADATILRQVVLNLVSNAIKFTQEQGSIIIALSASPPDDTGKVILHGSVTDDGLGMSEVEKQNVFQRFSQANRRVAQLYGGSGLGLSISKELLRTMGGEIAVKSEQGKGSTFSFTSNLLAPTEKELASFLGHIETLSSPLPGASELALTSGALDITNAVPKFRMVAVAEDNPINLKHLERHLKMLGYESTLCVNGKEAYDKVCEPGSRIDCIIMDMSMPVMDGMTSTRLIRKLEEQSNAEKGGKRKIPIIALSGNALNEQIKDALDSGCSDYLVKPCKQVDLGRSLNYWERIVHTGAEHRAMLGK
jgi:PAS domain S-box-containing protein